VLAVGNFWLKTSQYCFTEAYKACLLKPQRMQKGNLQLIEQYVATVVDKLKTGQAREHAYRPAFEALIKALDPTLQVVNDPSRSEHGNPDFVFLRGDITAGYAETKDVGVDLDKTEKTQQMERYLGYSNLILTDYLEFRFFRNGSRHGELIRIGTVADEKITPFPEMFSELATALSDFLASPPERIKSGKRLAKIMGGKARRIRDNVRRFLAAKDDQNIDLLRIYESVKKMLVHDLTHESFADMYAQTLVYGLFVARYHDESSDSFTRAEARDLVPESNPFLRQFFNHIAGPDFNKRLRYIVDELCEVFACANVRELMDEYFKKNGVAHGQDPVIHFYEDFLKEYDAELRKKMGAYYTPLPVVRFIVRAVDHILKSEFDLAEGLADTSKLPSGLHKVQVLDPAVGTGTFISGVIRIIYERLLEEGQKGRWPAYVHHDLLPRIHGFELMMAAYTIAHLKLSIAFKQTGFTIFNKRLGIYLTNSLEQSSVPGDLFSLGLSQSIAEEAKQAAVIKNEVPVMVVVGNPPYSGVSSNETKYANSLVKKYKVEPGGIDKLKERKHWLNDDYVKFIALAEDFIGRNQSGIVAFITNHGYLDNPTFRGMRWHLMNTFDSIYAIDLHGNSKKKEVSPDGGKDENVFEIQQGVSIIVAIKTGKKKKGDLARVHRFDIWGKREFKFQKLDSLSIKDIKWTRLEPRLPNLFFSQVGSVEMGGEYKKGFSIETLFPMQSMGVTSARDSFVIDESKYELLERINTFCDENKTDQEVRALFFGNKKEGKYKPGDSRGWKLDVARKKIRDFNHELFIKPISYRPFDTRYIYYSPDMVDWDRSKIMQNFIKGDNIGFCSVKLGRDIDAYNVFVTNFITDKGITSSLDNSNIFPLYLYNEQNEKTPNLNKEIWQGIIEIVGKATPENVFDYIYAVLHSPSYREKYKEFLKIDFPRIPYPKGAKQFRSLVDLGRELRSLHLLESPKVNQLITTYPKSGSNIVEKPQYKEGNVYINKEQYFGNVPEVAWNFWIGGYQPAQKWLKDRKGRELSNADIEHYQKIIVALTETARLMGEIDN
jgi:hypothetical protein